MTHKHLMRKKGHKFRDSTNSFQTTQKWKCKYCSYTEDRIKNTGIIIGSVTL